MKKIKKGDVVIVIAGKSKNHVGEISKVICKPNGNNKVIVEGANLVKKAIKPNPQLQQEGGIISKEAPISISNVAIYNSVSKARDKVVITIDTQSGKKIRCYRSTKEIIIDSTKKELANKIRSAE